MPVIELVTICVEPSDDTEVITWTVRMECDRIAARYFGAHIGVPVVLNFPDRHPADILKMVPAKFIDPDIAED